MKTAQHPSERLINSFGRTINKASSSELAPKQVHKLRTIARRIEALCEFSSLHLSGKENKTAQMIHDVRRTAGKVRDLDVQMELLKTIGNGSKHPHHQELDNYLEQKRERRAKKLFSEVQMLQKPKWRHRLKGLSAALNQRQAATSGSAALQSAKLQIAALAAKHKDSHQLHAPEQLHQLRIDLKKIRYTAELSAESPETKQFAKELEQGQDAIGIWHDWLMLTNTAQKAIGRSSSSAFFLQLRSLSTSAFGDAIKAAHKVLNPYHSPSRKPPQSALGQARSTRSA